jgi:nitrogen fixation NifU-like protein
VTQPAGALPSLYGEVILDHYRRPRNKGVLESPSVTISMHNPVCGDEIDLHLKVAGEHLEAVRFAGHGCSISQASASMMTQRAGGRSLIEVGELVDLFKELIRGSPEAARDRRLGDLRVLQGVSRFPVRIKCALLAWDALEEALRSHAAGRSDAGVRNVEGPDVAEVPPAEDRDLPL